MSNSLDPDQARRFVELDLGPNCLRGRTGLMVRASNSGSGDPGSILGRVGVLFP